MSPEEEALALVEAEAERAPDVVALAELASLAARVEPRLLRRLRIEVLPSSTTTATEADLWFSPLVEASSRDGVVFDPGCARVLRQRAATSPMVGEALALIQDEHSGAAPSLQLEEELVRIGLFRGADTQNLDRLLRRIAKAFLDTPERAGAIAHWLSRVVPRLPGPVASLPGARALGLWASEQVLVPFEHGVDQALGLGPWRSILGRSDDRPSMLIGARMLSDGLELRWPPGEPAHQIDAGPGPASVEIALDESEEPATTVTLERDVASSLTLAALRVVSGRGDSDPPDEWLHAGEVRQIAGHVWSELVAVLGPDGTVTVYDRSTRSTVRLRATDVSAVAVAGYELKASLVFVGRPGRVDVRGGDGKLMRTILIPGDRPRSVSGSVSPSRLLAVTTDGRLAGWEEIETGSGPPAATAWDDAGDGYLSAVLGWDGTVVGCTDTGVDSMPWNRSTIMRVALGGAPLDAVPTGSTSVGILRRRAGIEVVSVARDGTLDRTFDSSVPPEGNRLLDEGLGLAWMEPDGTVVRQSAMGEGVTRSPPLRPVRGLVGVVATRRGIVTAGAADRLEVRSATGDRHVLEALPTSRLGATVDRDAGLFRITAPDVRGADLCLFDADGAERPVAMHAGAGGEWWVRVPGIGPGQRYGFRMTGRDATAHNPAKLLLDPYARAFTGELTPSEALLATNFDDSAPYVPRSVVVADAFDWADDRSPAIPLVDSVIYEVHVKGATMLHPDVPPELRGTYAGLAHPAFLEHLVGLGVTAVQLLPVQQFVHAPSVVDRGLRNYWGYDPIGLFAPHHEYASGGESAQPVRELKEMVRALHRAGLEVILDVVFDHTGEGNAGGPTICHRGYDGRYYRQIEVDGQSHYEDLTGTGNTLDVRWPPVTRMVLESLRYWASEMHVDGFRFNMAATLMRDPEVPSRSAPLFELIRQDPALRRVKLIAEPWDIGLRGFQAGQFPPGWGELNRFFSDDVRDYWRGAAGARQLAARLGGSLEEYRPSPDAPFPVNFVTSHDGFTLADLVSYNEKHNEGNGEDNRDGASDNRSWNCGVEGPTDDPDVLELRARQQRNLLTTLLLSRGVPMLRGGDELGQSQQGNNNAWCQDNELSWLPWPERLPDGVPLVAFVRQLIDLRRRHPLIGGALGSAPDAESRRWLHPDGSTVEDGAWEGLSAFAVHMIDDSGEVFVGFNNNPEIKQFVTPPGARSSWTVVVGDAPSGGRLWVDEHGVGVIERLRQPGMDPPVRGLDGSQFDVVSVALRSTVEPDELAAWFASNRAAALEVQLGAAERSESWGNGVAAFIARTVVDLDAWLAVVADGTRPWGVRGHAARWLRFVPQPERAAASAAVSERIADGSIDGARLAVEAFGALADVAAIQALAVHERVSAYEYANEKLGWTLQRALLDAYVRGGDQVDGSEILVHLGQAITDNERFGNQSLSFFDIVPLLRDLPAHRAGPLLDMAASSHPPLLDGVLSELSRRPLPALAPRLAELGTENAYRALAAIDSPQAWELLAAAEAEGRPGADEALLLAAGVQRRNEDHLLDVVARRGWYTAWALGEHAAAGSTRAVVALEGLCRATDPFVQANALLGLAKAGVDISDRPTPTAEGADWPALVVAGIAGALAGDGGRFLDGLAASIEHHSPYWMLETHLVRDLEGALQNRLGPGGRLVGAFMDVAAGA